MTTLRLLVVLLAMWAMGGVSARAAADGAQDYRIARWTTTEGLPQNTINDIVTLPNGALWLATFGGLVRFDGARFHVVDIAGEADLASNRITALVPAGADAMWFVTQEGHLGRLEAGRVHRLITPHRSMPDVIGLVVTGGRFYVQTVAGNIWTTDGKVPWTILRGTPPTGALTALTRTSTDQAWASSGQSVVRLDAGDGGVSTTRMPAAPLAMAGGVDGDLWIGLREGVGHFAGGRLELLDVRPRLSGETTVVLYLSDHELWVAGDGVVSHLTAQPDGTWRRDELPLLVPASLLIRSLVVDSEGNLWVGTDGHGLFRAHRQSTRRFGIDTGLRAITALVSDGQGGAWAAGSCIGIFHVDESGATEAVHAPGTPPVPSGCENGFAPASGGDLWVRSQSQIYRVRRAGSRVTRLPVTVVDEDGPIVAAADGTLWVASRGGDVQRVSADRVIEQVTLPGQLWSATLAPDGTLWVGGFGEIFHVPGGGRPVERIGATQGVPRGPVRDLLVDRDGTVWIATYGGGLGHMHDGRLTRFTVREGLPDNSLSRVLDDGRGRLWVSTNRGLVVLERSEVAEVLAGTRRRLTPVIMGVERGVPEANFGWPAGFANRHGQMWFGTIEGLVRVDASRFPFNPIAPAVRVDRVLADERPLPISPVVQIPAGTGRVRLDFSAMALRYPERVQFRFRIEGIDREWVDVGQQAFATFTPAAPGQHRFLLQARNEDGVWNSTPIVVELTVLPAWWQTGAARLGAIVGVLLLAVGLYRFRVSALERRHDARVRALEEQRRAEEQLSTLRRQLEHVSRVTLAGELAASLAHEVNQPLTAIVADAETAQHLVSAGGSTNPDLAEILGDIAQQGLRASEVVQGLRDLLRPGLPEMRDVDVSQLVREMRALVRRELEDHGVQVRLHLADALPLVPGRRVQLGQVIVNLMMNASEALAAQDGPRIVEVRTHTAGARVEIVVADNGPGLRPDVAERIFEPFVSSKPQGMGMGLAICRSIAEAHRGRLTATNRPEGGLVVILSLPVSGTAVVTSPLAPA